MILGLPILNYQEVGEFFLNKDLQLLIVDKKVSFDGNTASFNNSYFCYKFLPRDIIFEHLENNNYIYKLDNVLISRFKVLKIYKQIMKQPNLDKVNGLLFALTYNSLLSNADYELIKEYVEHWRKCIQKEEFNNGFFKTI